MTAAPSPVAPLISVVIPVYNRRERIVAALRSVGAGDPALCEIVVVDDGSTDGTPEAVAQAAQDLGLGGLLRLERQANAGPGAARNRGAGLARGRWLAFLDSDDVWFPWTLPLLAQALRDDPEPGMMLMRTAEAAPDDLAAGRGPQTLAVDRYDNFLRAFAAMRNTSKTVITGACNFVIERALFLRLGGFDPALWHSEDVDLFLRTHPHPCRIVDAPEMMRYERGAGGNLTHNIANMTRAVAHIHRVHHVQRAARFGPDATIMAEYFSGIAHYAIRLAFSRGRPIAAWRLWLAHLRPLLGQPPRRWAMTLRLGATPALALLRPGRGHVFRPWPGAREWGKDPKPGSQDIL